jgi:hypothetical protein
MSAIEDAVAACLKACEDSKAPAVFIEGYCRELAKQPGWSPEDMEEVQLQALGEALLRLRNAKK